MGSGTFTVAIIGGGGIVRSHHLPGLRAVPGVVVHGVAGRDAARSREFASQLGLAIAYPDWQEAIADAEVDAVVIGTWPDTHEDDGRCPGGRKARPLRGTHGRGPRGSAPHARCCAATSRSDAPI